MRLLYKRRLAERKRPLHRHVHSLDDDLRIPTLAKRYGLTSPALRLRFQNVEGETLGAYIRRTRMECAAEDLLFGESVREVSVSCNYDSQASFIKAFKRAYGCSPIEYKLAHGATAPAGAERWGSGA